MQAQSPGRHAPSVRDRLQIHAQSMDRQTPEARIRNFEEVSLGFDLVAGMIEAARCLQCPTAPCQDACPVSTDIPAALALMENGDIVEAAEKFRETNSLPEMCGRLCPQELLCEGACVVGFAIRPGGRGEPPVAIGNLEAFASDYHFRRSGGHPRPRYLAPPSGYRVAIVGSGPAGLTAAEYLAVHGHECTIMESWSEPGGALVHGIPGFKMKKQIVDGYLRFLRDLGVEIRCGVSVGQDITVDEMLGGRFDAVFLGTGAAIAKKPGIKGEDLDGVVSARDFILQGSLPPSTLPRHLRRPPVPPRRVVVVGGDDTAVDCARTAVRLGAERVVCVYAGDESEMIARLEGRQRASEEGVEFMEYTAPLRIFGDMAGAVSEVELVRLEPRVERGQTARNEVAGSEFLLDADTVAFATGFSVDRLASQSVRALEVDASGRIRTDSSGRTSMEGLFAGGDNVQGADKVVTAVAAGRRAGEAIVDYLAELERKSRL